MTRKRPKIENNLMVFIPLINGMHCAGRVFVEGDVFFIGVDSKPIDDISTFDCRDFCPNVYSWTTDAEIWRGRWKCPGLKCSTFIDFPKPEYLLGSGENLRVIGFLGDYTRPIESPNDHRLKRRKSRSPNIIELAVNARNGLCELEDWFEEISA